MRKRITVSIWLLALSMGVAAAQESAEAAGESRVAAESGTQMDAIFQEIVQDAHQIGVTLSGITDKESADAAVQPLEALLNDMSQRLRTLEETVSTRQGQDSEALKAHMSTLTHFSQSALNTMQRLIEVNAYGSEKLMALFTHYKLDGDKITHLQAEDMPHTQLYNELADRLEDALYTLGSIQDAASAANAVDEIREQLKVMERTRSMLSLLAPPTTEEQREAVRPARERLQKISAEIKNTIDKLQSVRCYSCSELDAMLPSLLHASAL